MPGDYQSFPVTRITAAGVQESVGGGVDVFVRKDGAVSDVAESPLSTNSDGEIVAGTIAALSPDDIVHFRVENFEGGADSTTQTLT